MQTGYISEFCKGRNNNLNLIRFIAAVSVLISHSYPLYYGTPTSEPLLKLIGRSAGEISVDIFFITSGFLITKSFLSRLSMKNYLWSRLIRIYPGLWFVLALTLIVFIPISHPATYKDIILSSDAAFYIVKNAIMIARPTYVIDGAYEDVPYAGAINGSLWTLPWEIYCYIFVAMGILTIQKIFKNSWPKFYLLGVLVALTYTLGADLNVIEHNKKIVIVIAFYVGSLYYIYRESIMMKNTYFITAVIIMLINFFTMKSVLAYILTLPYILLYIAYIPKGKIRQFNNFGDYSYGIYIFAFPVQQSVISMIPNIGFPAYTILSLAITLVFAWISWRYVEERSLKLKNLVI